MANDGGEGDETGADEEFVETEQFAVSMSVFYAYANILMEDVYRAPNPVTRLLEIGAEFRPSPYWGDPADPRTPRHKDCRDRYWSSHLCDVIMDYYNTYRRHQELDVGIASFCSVRDTMEYVMKNGRWNKDHLSLLKRLAS